MDFSISEEHRILLDSLRKFLRREIIPLEESLGTADSVPYDIHLRVKRLSREAGFYGIHLPEEVGGGGLNTLGLCLLLEELGRSMCERLGSNVIGGFGGPTPLLLDCSDSQKERYLYPTVRAEKTLCFALTEPGAGSDAAAIETRAAREGEGFVINGRKHFITNAPFADFALVFAVTDSKKRARGGITCFLVDKGTPGFSVGRIHETMTGSGMHAELLFEDCYVPASQILGQEGMGFIQAMKWISQGRLSIAAHCVGVADKLIKRSVEYANIRFAFGNPISRYQGIQFMLADMAIAAEASRSMVYHAAWLADQGKEIVKEASMAKLFASEMIGKVADSAIQIHGGAGFMKDLPLERIYRGVRAARIGEGTSEIQRNVIARELLKETP